MIRCSIGLIIICMLFGRPSLAADLPLPRTPIYDSHSQSYFQLFGDNVHPGNWEAARIRAAQKFYKGVQGRLRSEEHTSELQSLMRNPYAVFCLKKKKTNNTTKNDEDSK